jgi:hypothetical protein
MRRGAEFADIQPRDNTGTFSLGPTLLTTAAAAPDLNNALVQQITPNNAFRGGQQILFWLGIFNPEEAGPSHLESIRLKPWWARQNMEYRQAGARNGDLGAPVDYLPIDTHVFAGDGLADNRYIWMPSPSRLQVTPFATVVPPALPLALTSDSIMLDDVWKLDLQDPTVAAYSDTFQTGQVPSRWVTFMYPAMGYALGFTWSGVFSGPDVPVNISLTWTIGTLGGSNYQESIG